MDEENKFKELKKGLFMAGDAYIEEFLGFTEDIKGMTREEKEMLMNEAYAQMPDEELNEFYAKYNVR